jgi:demethylmenaquinone methyltransferase/2-methoxy-6-polyprenyl-1,4-benzoquinol methylase
MHIKHTSDEPYSVLPVLQSKDETKAFYNKISRFYDLLSERAEQPARERGLELLAAKAGERVLEIGFGTGHCLGALAEAVGPSGRVYGIDISEGMLQQARKLLGDRGLTPRVDLRCADALSPPYDRETMDRVFMSFTLELFDTPEISMLLAECRRLLRRGGRIVVVGMSKEGKEGVAVRAFEWTHQHFPNFLDCRPIFVRRALEDAGFKLEALEMMHMWVPVEIVRAMKPAAG